jgi:hypothetical protein
MHPPPMSPIAKIVKKSTEIFEKIFEINLP